MSPKCTIPICIYQQFYGEGHNPFQAFPIGKVEPLPQTSPPRGIGRSAAFSDEYTPTSVILN